jgi:hypothetical protein
LPERTVVRALFSPLAHDLAGGPGLRRQAGPAPGPANQAFAPPADDYSRAVAIIEAYSHATTVDQRGAVMFGDETIDEAIPHEWRRPSWPGVTPPVSFGKTSDGIR